MKPLIVLLVTFGIVLGVRFIAGSPYDPYLAGRIAMCVMLVFTSIAHFVFNKGMAMMLPSSIPARSLMVYLTGVFEIILGIGLIVPSAQVVIAWVTIGFFIIMLPANIYAAMLHVNYEKASYDGKGPSYLWIRIPMQLFFIGWVYFAAIYPGL